MHNPDITATLKDDRIATKRFPAALALVAIVAGCQAAQVSPAVAAAQARGVSVAVDLPSGVEAVTDPITGCQYPWTPGASLTPRYEQGGRNSAGAPINSVRGCN